MAHIEVIGKPRGASERYQFFRNIETGQEWKALLELREARPAFTNQADVESAPLEMAVSVTVSPINNVGKALRENDKPVIIDTLTHTFTVHEMLEPDFDPQARIAQIIAERIHLGEARLHGNKKLKALVGKWNGKTKLKIGRVKYEEGHN